jgi:hypothetical protein
LVENNPFDVGNSRGAIPMEPPASSGRLGGGESAGAPTWGDLMAEKEEARGGAGAIFSPGNATVPPPAEPAVPAAPDHSAEVAELRGQVAGLGQALGRQPQVDPNAIAYAVANALGGQAHAERQRQAHAAAMAPPVIQEDLAREALLDPAKMIQVVDQIVNRRIGQAAAQIEPDLAVARQLGRVGPQVVQGQITQAAQAAGEKAARFGIGAAEFGKLLPEAIRQIHTAPGIDADAKTNMLLSPDVLFNAVTLVRNQVGPMEPAEEPTPTLTPTRRASRNAAPAGNSVHNAMLDRTEKILGVKFTKEERAAARQDIAAGRPSFERAMR